MTHPHLAKEAAERRDAEMKAKLEAIGEKAMGFLEELLDGRAMIVVEPSPSKAGRLLISLQRPPQGVPEAKAQAPKVQEVEEAFV